MGSFSSKHQVVPFNNDSYYIGPTNNNNELDGQGKFIDELGNCYVGSFKNNNFNGYGVMNYDLKSHYPDYKVLPTYYEGNWKDNTKHGKGTIYYSDGSKYQGLFKFDELHGKGKFTFPSGIYYIGYINTGNITGFGTLFTQNNLPIYKGYWLKNLYHGKGTYFEDGKLYYIGCWSSGYCNGFGTIYDTKGYKSYKAIFKNGQIDKIIKNYYPTKFKLSNFKLTKFKLSNFKNNKTKTIQIPSIKTGTKTFINPFHSINIKPPKLSSPQTIKLNSDKFTRVTQEKKIFYPRHVKLNNTNKINNINKTINPYHTAIQNKYTKKNPLNIINNKSNNPIYKNTKSKKISFLSTKNNK